MDNFGGYTAQAGNIFGYWREDHGRDSYGEHREFSIAAPDASKLPILKQFLAEMARDLKEECVYFRSGHEASLIHPVSVATDPPRLFRPAADEMFVASIERVAHGKVTLRIAGP